MRKLHKLGFVNFGESKGKVIRNARNRKSEYVAIQCRLEYQGKKALSFGSFKEYSRLMQNNQKVDDRETKDDLKIFISHSETDVKIAEKHEKDTTNIKE